MTNVLVSVPNQGDVHKHVVFVLLKLSKDPRYRTTIILPTHSPYENNLHHIVNDFMDGDYGYWLNIDSDNPPINNPLDLVELDLDIVGLPTPVWHYTGQEGERPIYWNGYLGDERGYTEYPDRSGLQKVDAIGSGCMLVARRVFECPLMRVSPFERKTRIDGTVETGADIAFCQRAQESGFTVWAHYGYPCLHFNNLELNEVVSAFKGLGVT